MAHPLLSYARRLERRAAARRAIKAQQDVEADPHLARDVGLPHRNRENLKVELW